MFSWNIFESFQNFTKNGFLTVKKFKYYNFNHEQAQPAMENPLNDNLFSNIEKISGICQKEYCPSGFAFVSYLSNINKNIFIQTCFVLSNKKNSPGQMKYIRKLQKTVCFILIFMKKKCFAVKCKKGKKADKIWKRTYDQKSY